MTTEQFFNKYNGKFIDIDGKFGCQCMDLMRTYIKEVCGLDPYIIPRVDYAKNVFKNFKDNKYFKKIVNTPTGVPQKGDIMFWNTYLGVTGIAGHVAIYSDGNVNKFISFDQNYPTGSSCHFVNHSYKGIAGWLRPIK